MATAKTIPISLSPGGLEPAILRIIEQLNEQADLPAYIDLYVQHASIDEARFTDEVRAGMVEYLRDRGAVFTSADEVTQGDHDELFALAYENAVVRRSGGEDPINAAFLPGGGTAGTAWDFNVELLDDVEQQGVVKENILAAGAIDYIFELGEHMGVFRLVDALVLNWASGAIDVVEGDVVSRLYRYWKLRDQRPSPEERGMLYRRVLSKGGAEVLDRMVVNEELPNLWHNLMSEVADYIDKTERVEAGSTESSPVSRSRMFQAVRDLQYNLTEYCTGMAHIQARELYAQLQECVELLRDPEILAYFGGNRRKSLWTAIEQMSKQEFGASPSIAALRSLAVDGNVIFRFIANYSDGGVRQEEFNAFLQSAESYILNYQSAGESLPGYDEDEADADEGEFDDEAVSEDEF